MTYTLTKLPDERITGNLESFWLRIGFNLDRETIKVTDAQLGIYQSQSSKTKPRPGRPGFDKPTASYAIADRRQHIDHRAGDSRTAAKRRIWE